MVIIVDRWEVDIMSFAENLKQFRKEKQLSQEELAEILDVSRQAVSKWEQGNGYPEVEKLLLLSNQLHISLDSLLSTQFAQEDTNKNVNITGTIIIMSPYENAIVTCNTVVSSGKMSGGKLSPQYALFGVRNSTASFLTESNIFLGWYANKEQVTKEILEIQNAIVNGIATYTLKYSAKTKKKWTGIKIIEE